MTLSWDDPGDDTVTGYVILRRDKATQAAGTFSTVTADTGTADTTYVDAYVERNRRYLYRVQAINPAGVSERSRWARGYTPRWLNSPERPAKPRGLAAETTHDTVTLSWEDPGDDSITGYVILRRDKDTHDKGIFATLAPDTGTAHTAYVDATARPDRRYVYRVKAINTAGHSTTAWTRGWTPPAPPPDSDPAADGDSAADADTTADNTETADMTSTTHSPPPETPNWARGFVTSYTHASSGSGGGLATPERFLVRTAQHGATFDLSWDPVENADGYEVYVLATRNIGGSDREWWVEPSEDEHIILSPSGIREESGRVVTSLFSLDGPDHHAPDVAPFLPDHFVLAVSAYRETVGGTKWGWSHWRGAIVERKCSVWSYDLFDEFEEEDDLYTVAGDQTPVQGCPNYVAP
ncbi:fibronectin type III domain-containing protein [Candidatus Poriferisodalis sp.]|uniref:fibronectin type III domain-containing protein n=1 Tax=Candidatus Poriferisodalis sp. TaxID=3101277 RepID=UPI003B5BF565